jgi:hypothetical protein
LGVWRLVETVAVAAPRGRVWRAVFDVASGELGASTSPNRIDVVDEPRELAWTSYLPNGGEIDDEIAFHWFFRLASSWTGTDVEHGCSWSGDDRSTAIRRAMLATLSDVKSRAERQ